MSPPTLTLSTFDAGRRLATSPLLAAGGYAVVRMLDDEGLALLAGEAFACHAQAVETHKARPTDEDVRRGDPARWLESAVGGPALHELYTAPVVLTLLEQMTGVPWAPSGPQGSFSYYRRAGHHLDLHRDIDECDLAIITCLYERGAGDAGGTVCLYPGRLGERLSDIRATPAKGVVSLRLAPGQSLILLGGIVAHCVLPLGDGHTRIITPLCYRAAVE